MLHKFRKFRNTEKSIEACYAISLDNISGLLVQQALPGNITRNNSRLLRYLHEFEAYGQLETYERNFDRKWYEELNYLIHSSAKLAKICLIYRYLRVTSLRDMLPGNRVNSWIDLLDVSFEIKPIHNKHTPIKYSLTIYINT